MEKKIIALNSALFEDRIDWDQYERLAQALLLPLDLNRRVKYANMIYVTV